MPERPNLLILDDETDFVDLYRDLLGRLPSNPQIHTATSGARALALLESEPFSLLITDLAMPGMDGFQVLALVRRRLPTLRTVVLTAIADEQYRARAYAMGIDLFMEKPTAEKDIKLFTDCIESLLERPPAAGGFRGVQSKSLVDLIQLESLSQGSSVLRITNGPLEGKIWIQNGDVIDAATQDVKGEEAFRKILGWKSGSFEILPAEPKRPRTIRTSTQGLLLDTAQALDETEASAVALAEATPDQPAPGKLAPFTRCRGVQFVLTAPVAESGAAETWGLEGSQQLSAWVRQTMQQVRQVSELLNAGPLESVLGLGSEHHLVCLPGTESDLCAGIRRSFDKQQARETLKELAAKWAS